MKKVDASPTEFFKDYRDFVAFLPNRYGKATLFENEQVLVGLNCLEPRQAMEKHAHLDQHRFYLVTESALRRPSTSRASSPGMDTPAVNMRQRARPSQSAANHS